MNIVDYGILLLMTVSIVAGIYNGFVISALNAASFVISWLGALLFYPVMSKALMGKFPELFTRLEYYADGSSKIPTVEARTAPLASFTTEQVSHLLEDIQMPNPFNRILATNVFSTHQLGVQTLGQYFDYTIASVVVNILSFLLLFFILKLIFSIAISVAKAVVNLPVLKQFDSFFGAGFGVLRGMFVLYFIFALIPIVLTLAPLDMIRNYLDHSRFASSFYQFNIFTSFVRGRF